jgi:hypothetical protein
VKFIIDMNRGPAQRRGSEPVVGNVYRSKSGKSYCRVLVSIVPLDKWGGPFNNMLLIALDADGNIVGCKMEPKIYTQDHMDLIGRVRNFQSVSFQIND